MNPDYQQFLTDEWLPPERELDTVTLISPDHAEIVELGTPTASIRTNELIEATQ